ncbi:MAG: hypothetical protein DRO06_04965 [Thermoproteota archaeon]|nr:MAG: hypothetical protein DRO06_04965 [Candidatus Korarchaeota archaeon]
MRVSIRARVPRAVLESARRLSRDPARALGDAAVHGAEVLSGNWRDAPGWFSQVVERVAQADTSEFSEEVEIEVSERALPSLASVGEDPVTVGRCATVGALAWALLALVGYEASTGASEEEAWEAVERMGGWPDRLDPLSGPEDEYRRTYEELRSLVEWAEGLGGPA